MISSYIAKKVIYNALEQTKFGQIKISVGSEPSEVFGDGPFICELKLKDLNVLSRVARGGDIAVAEAIMANELQITNETAFIEWACRNDEVLKKAFHGTWLGTLMARIKSKLNENTVTGSKKNIMAHYDLGNKFYQSWLDPSMSYSSALFKDAQFSEDLTQAQYNKYDRIIDELEIKSSDHVLEIGCGWGGFFSRVIERTGCKVTAVMNSPAQAEFNRELIGKKGFKDQVDLQQIDYRQIKGTFDKIVSIEMIEAVGYQYWSTYFDKVSSSLKSKGKAVIQAITINESRFEDYLKNPDFINTYIFPGGMLLTNESVRKNAELKGMSSDTPFEFGLSYAETLNQWREKFNAVFDSKLSSDFDDRFRRLWNFYFSYCEGAFRADRINVAHFSIAKN
ncbi:MAG: class I SAM-dependent methyltransferase [Bdellovibrionaceae bacterium]|nr:class I SAM-dependent methyltransferase [Pseudobdellovibrionaceae bacterium]